LQELVDALRVEVLGHLKCIVLAEAQTSHQMGELLLIDNAISVRVNLLELLNEKRQELFVFSQLEV
jgi:hypothetical protein